MTKKDFTTGFLVDKSPMEVFNAVNNVRGWWSEEVEGDTDKLNAVFLYHYKDIHRCSMKIIEFIPGKKVVWLVEDNYFNFIEDKTEWIGNKIIFEISEYNGQTELLFTQQGLVPAYECFDVCRDAWSNYIKNSLHSLIVNGKGKPNPKDGEAIKQEGQSFRTSFSVHATPEQTFNCINSVNKWWTENVEGGTKNLNDEFSVRFFEDVHYSKQRIVELIPNKKITWLVTESQLNFLEDKNEWDGTKIIFELVSLGDKFTRIEFTHLGLVPEIECYKDCSNAWTPYLQQSLFSLIETGKGQPTKRDAKLKVK